MLTTINKEKMMKKKHWNKNNQNESWKLWLYNESNVCHKKMFESYSVAKEEMEILLRGLQPKVT